MASFKDYVEHTLENWDSQEAEHERERFRDAINCELQRTKKPQRQAVLEALLGSIDDECFWAQVYMMTSLELPK